MVLKYSSYVTLPCSQGLELWNLELKLVRPPLRPHPLLLYVYPSPVAGDVSEEESEEVATVLEYGYEYSGSLTVARQEAALRTKYRILNIRKSFQNLVIQY